MKDISFSINVYQMPPLISVIEKLFILMTPRAKPHRDIAKFWRELSNPQARMLGWDGVFDSSSYMRFLNKMDSFELVGIAENISLSLESIRVMMKWEPPSFLQDEDKQADRQRMEEIYQEISRIPDKFLTQLRNALVVDFLLYEKAKVLLNNFVTKPKS